MEIGQTIKDLDIDASPEEVLREIQAQRDRAAAAKAAKEAEAAKKLQRPAVVSLPPVADYYQPRRRSRSRILSPILAGMLVVWLVTNGHLFHHTSAVQAPDRVITFSQATDGQVVYTDTQGVEQLMGRSSDASKGSLGNVVLVHTAQQDNSWPIVVHGNKVYLHGFITPTPDNAIASSTLKIYNGDNAGDLEGNPYKFDRDSSQRRQVHRTDTYIGLVRAYDR